jgi:hypothetical protein
MPSKKEKDTMFASTTLRKTLASLRRELMLNDKREKHHNERRTRNGIVYILRKKKEVEDARRIDNADQQLEQGHPSDDSQVLLQL